MKNGHLTQLYGFTQNPKTLDYMIVMNEYNLCSYCYDPYDKFNWCKECNAKMFQQNFSNWTSGNEFIDNFIQNIQLNAYHSNQILEWIPYNRFKNIEYLDKEGSIVICKAIWLDAYIKGRSNNKKKWIRFKGNQANEKKKWIGYQTVILKSINNISNLIEELNKV